MYGGISIIDGSESPNSYWMCKLNAEITFEAKMVMDIGEMANQAVMAKAFEVIEAKLPEGFVFSGIVSVTLLADEESGD